MAIDKKNKEEIKIYYELNNEKPKDIALKFGIKYRTLMFWIKQEGWIKGKHKENIKVELVQNELLQKEHFSLQNATANKIKRKLIDNIGNNDLNEILLNNMLDSATDKILLEAMNLNFIQKNITMAALIAKDELKRMIALRKDNEANPLIVASAEKMAKIFSDMQILIYGKEPIKAQNIDAKTDFSKLSNSELLAIINSSDEKEKEG